MGGLTRRPRHSLRRPPSTRTVDCRLLSSLIRSLRRLDGPDPQPNRAAPVLHDEDGVTQIERVDQLGVSEPQIQTAGGDISVGLPDVKDIARAEKINHQLFIDGRTLAAGIATGGINQRYLQSTFAEAEADLAGVEADLAVAARHPGIGLELCLACWEIDWNRNGRVDERDRLLFQIEQDERGEEIHEGDPRRKPTFRFDDGDVAWPSRRTRGE